MPGQGHSQLSLPLIPGLMRPVSLERLTYEKRRCGGSIGRLTPPANVR
jgi:hypothetical protein